MLPKHSGAEMNIAIASNLVKFIDFRILYTVIIIIASLLAHVAFHGLITEIQVVGRH